MVHVKLLQVPHVLLRVLRAKPPLVFVSIALSLAPHRHTQGDLYMCFPCLACRDLWERIQMQCFWFLLVTASLPRNRAGGTTSFLYILIAKGL